MNSHRWLLIFSLSVFLLMLVFTLMTYVMDPYFQFRVKDNYYLIDAQHVNPGLIKNYDYDTLIIGSSMVQNFNMDLFRQELHVKPLHVTLGGMTPRELLELFNLATKVNKSRAYYICVDLPVFTYDDYTKHQTSQYLLKDDSLSVLQYLFNYESWVNILPFRLYHNLLKIFSLKPAPLLTFLTSIDYLENWAWRYDFGEEIVLKNYSNNLYALSSVRVENLYSQMTQNMESFLNSIEQINHSNRDIYFFFPPYSSLFWYSAKDYRDTYLAAKRYFIEQACSLGFTVYDFQSAEFTSDLNYYKDSTHYSPEINDWMTHCFAENKYRVTPQQCEAYHTKLMQNLLYFENKYAPYLR